MTWGQKLLAAASWTAAIATAVIWFLITGGAGAAVAIGVIEGRTNVAAIGFMSFWALLFVGVLAGVMLWASDEATKKGKTKC